MRDVLYIGPRHERVLIGDDRSEDRPIEHGDEVEVRPSDHLTHPDRAASETSVRHDDNGHHYGEGHQEPEQDTPNHQEEDLNRPGLLEARLVGDHPDEVLVERCFVRGVHTTHCEIGA